MTSLGTPALRAALRDARQKRGLTIAEFSKRISVHQSYVSGAETGSKPVSMALIRKYAAALDLTVDDFLYSSESSATSLYSFPDSVFSTFLTTKTELPGEYHFSAPSPRLPSQAQNCGSEEEIVNALRMLFHRECSQSNNGSVTIFWSARVYGPGTKTYDTLIDTLIPTLLACGGRVIHIFRNATEDKAVFDTILMIAALAKRYSAFEDRYTCLILPHVNIRAMPVDLYCAAHSGFVATMGHQLFLTPTRGFFVPEMLEAVDLYMNMMAQHAISPTNIFRPERGLEFLTEYAKTEAIEGGRFMIQRPLANVSRPTDHFRDGSKWFERMMLRYKDRERVRALATQRTQSANEFLRRVTRHDIRQIACEEALVKWARTGLRHDQAQYPGSLELYVEDAAERLARIDHVRSLLGTFDRFELAIVSESRFRHLTGMRVAKPPYETAWVVQGRESVWIEIMNTAQEHDRNTYQAIITSGRECVADAFANEFNLEWQRLSKSERGKAGILARLDDLKKLI